MQKKGSKNNNASEGLLPWIKALSYLLPGLFATLLTVLAVWGALYQKPHINAYRTAPSSLLSPDYWAYPIEQNAFRRLPVIGSGLNDVFALPGSLQVWAVGDHGLIAHSDDGGIIWERQEVTSYKTVPKPQDAQKPNQPVIPKQTFFSERLLDVMFTDAEHGWAVGDNGVIVSTQDGGAHWQAQENGTNWAAFYAVAFTDNTHGWVVGFDGVVVATQDGGAHWQKQSSGTYMQLGDVTFADSTHGWTVSDNGVIIATQDGGANWQKQDSGTDKALTGVAFSDNKHGWAVGWNGVIVATQDGGANWQVQSSSTDRILLDVTFSDSNHGWAVGDNGVIVATQDGGAHWQAQNSSTDRQLHGVAFSDSAHGWAVGDNGVIVATQDGGAHWQAQSSGSLIGVAFSDSAHGWAVGDNGVIVATRDGGAHWQVQSSGIGWQLESVFFADSVHGWAVGKGGVIVATLDGGAHWQAQSSGRNNLLSSVAFSDNAHGWAVGSGGVIVATQDGGAHWQAQSRDTRTWLNSVTFSDSSYGWAVGKGGVIVATQNSGAHWQAQNSGTGNWLLGVAFRDSMHGWAVGSDGMIAATQDGGAHWQTQSSGTDKTFRGVVFSDSTHGWAVGSGGVIVSTQDGGAHWQAQSSGKDGWLFGVAFSDSTHGWAVGENGVILSTQDGGAHWQDIVYRRFPAPWFYAAMLAAIALFARAWASFVKSGVNQTPNAGIANHVVTDKPAGPGSPDFLGARRIAQELTRFLVNRNTQPPVTIAITGEWGSGKSSIMNYLFAGLKREGLRPVWFNAWHHREEQNVLASILANVHRQAVRPWWSPSGFCFRLRLLWKRNWLVKSLLLTVLFGVALLTAWLVNSPDKWRESRDYALYLLHIEEPVILAQQPFKALCPVTAASGEAKQPNSPVQASATTAAQTPLAQAEASAAKADARQESALFSPEQCGSLQALTGPAVKYHNSLQCGTDAPHLCFASSNDLLRAVEQRLGLELTTEAEARLLKAVEHLHPDPPVPFSPTLLKWLSGLIALIGLLAVKGMALLGLSQVQLFQGLLNKSGIVMQPAEPVGSRLLFERHFKLITELLGRRRLVLFIDDLDRCDREHTRKVLEITNFLASSGDLFMVLGMAPRYVLANVTLSFQDLAKAVHEADMLNGENADGAANKDAGQSWFARHYLQKLIHIEVPVPKAKTEQVLAMLAAGAGDEDKTEELELRIDSLLAAFGKLLRVGLLIAALGGGAYWGYSLDQPQPAVPLAQDTGQKTVTTSGNSEPANKGQETAVEPKAEEPSKPEVVFKSGYGDENIAHWPVWLALLLTVGMFGGALGLFYLTKHVEIIGGKKWLLWLAPLLHRLKVKLVGPELRDDSASFTDALAVWHKLIAITDPSPRNLKAFLNRLRYFASRYSGTVDNQREAQLVALATMHYAFDEDLDEALALMQAYETNNAQSKFASSPLREDDRWMELDAALKAHWAMFSAFPSQEDRASFKELCEDIRIHKRD